VIEELKLCTDKNPDKELFACDSAPEGGNLVVVNTLVTGSLTFFEPNVKGADLALKIPGVGGIEGGRSYSAVQLSLRAIDVKTRKLKASVATHAIVPSDKAGAELSGGGFTLRAAAHARTPFGDALDTMLQDAVAKLKGELD
jgi:curli biogenesis system outer membrane secretion channel CsgG